MLCKKKLNKVKKCYAVQVTSCLRKKKNIYRIVFACNWTFIKEN